MRLSRGAALLCLLVPSFCLAGNAVDWRLDRVALQGSLESLRPWQRIRSLADRGMYRDYCAQNSWVPGSQGLSCIGRWSYGPSYKISVHTVGLDTIILLTRGSGATLARIRTTGQVTIEPLGEIDCHGIPHRAVMSGSLVCVGDQRGGTGLEVFDASDLTAPRRTAYVSLPSINDIAVNDTLVYLACADDSLRIFSVADPAAPMRVGACRDTSDLAMCYSDGYCYLVHASGINIVDVRDPRNPHRAGKIAGNAPLAVQVRDSLCYMTTESAGFRVYDVADPATPFPVGSISLPAAADLCLPQNCDTLAVTSYLHLISIANPSSPRLIGQVNSPGWDDGVGVAPALDYAFIADHFDGVVAVDITNPASPAIDTMALAGGLAIDINVDNGRAYVGSQYAGLTVLDVTNPALPRTLGSYDTIGQQPVFTSAVGRDSFAYLGWPRPRVLSIDVTDPTRPARAAGCEGMFAWPEDMVLRDSWLYCAEGSRFQVANVARPREPRLVGNCVVGEFSAGLTIRDTLAYVGNSPVAIVSVAEPTNPRVVGTIARGAWNVDLLDTFAFLPSGGVLVYSVADPSQPRILDSVSVGPNTYWVEVVGSVAYLGNRDGVRALDVTDIHNMRVIGFAPTPYSVTRLHYAPPYVYVACWDAGVCIFESSQVAIGAEVARLAGLGDIRVIPNPTSSGVWLSGYPEGKGEVVVRDALGREVLRVGLSTPGRGVRLGLSGVSAGVYFVEVRTTAGAVGRARLVKR